MNSRPAPVRLRRRMAATSPEKCFGQHEVDDAEEEHAGQRAGDRPEPADHGEGEHLERHVRLERALARPPASTST